MICGDCGADIRRVAAGGVESQHQMTRGRPQRAFDAARIPRKHLDLSTTPVGIERRGACLVRAAAFGSVASGGLCVLRLKARLEPLLGLGETEFE